MRLPAMAHQLVAMGHEVEIVTALPNYPTGRIFPQYHRRFYIREVVQGIVVHRVWLHAATGAGLGRMLNYGSFSLASLWGLWHGQRPDYVFVESPPLFLFIPGFLSARYWNAKTVFNVADLWPDSVREMGLVNDGWLLKCAKHLERWIYRKADMINAVTEGIRQVLIQEKGVPRSKVLFLPNGVDTDLFKPRAPNTTIAQKLGLLGKRIILYAGTMGYAQGLETLIEAAELLRKNRDIVFVLIGGGSERWRLAEMAIGLELDNVLFLDPAPPEYIAELYSLSVAGLAVLRDLPVFQGARPSKVFPAMASGVPVIFSGTGEGARLVQSAQAGLAVPPENPRALAEAVVRIVNDPDLAGRFGQNGRTYAEKHLAWPALIEGWLEQLTANGLEHRESVP